MTKHVLCKSMHQDLLNVNTWKMGACMNPATGISNPSVKKQSSVALSKQHYTCQLFCSFKSVWLIRILHGT